MNGQLWISFQKREQFSKHEGGSEHRQKSETLKVASMNLQTDLERESAS